MYDTWYNSLKKWFGPSLRLCFMDTDSFLFETSIDPEAVMAQHPELFDTSNYSKGHHLYDVKNMKVLGKFKSNYKHFLIQTFFLLFIHLFVPCRRNTWWLYFGICRAES